MSNNPSVYITDLAFQVQNKYRKSDRFYFNVVVPETSEICCDGDGHTEFDFETRVQRRVGKKRKSFKFRGHLKVKTNLNVADGKVRVDVVDYNYQITDQVFFNKRPYDVIVLGYQLRAIRTNSNG